jgi:hypothetical protein
MSKTKDGRHHFKWLKYNKQNIRVDADIASMIQKMWKLGIETCGSCQEHCSFNCKHKYKYVKDEDGIKCLNKIKTKNCYSDIWIVFPSSEDLEKFLNVVAEYSPEKNSVYELILGNKKLKDSWSYLYPRPENLGTFGHWGRPTVNGKRHTYEVWIEDGCKKNNFKIEPQLCFPRKHLEYVNQRLDSALK